jgi:hypothetical protein
MRGDFQFWAEHSLQDPHLAQQFEEIRHSNLEGENLRKTLVSIAESRLTVSGRKVWKRTGRTKSEK